MRWLAAMLVVLLSGCSCTAEDKKTQPEDPANDDISIDWQNPQGEAQQAIQRGDFALWIEARRGVVVLGLEDIAPIQIEERCGLKYLPDSGDVYRPEQREVRKQKREFGLEYNRLVIPYCLKKLQL